MRCPEFDTTLSPECCIRRQEIARRGYATKKIKTRENEHRIFNTTLPDSFELCVNCTTGKLVRLFPQRYIRSDFIRLIKEQLKILKERGYVFKSSVDLICIVIAEKNKELDDKNRIELIDYIAEISQKLVKEKKINGKSYKVLSASGCRIARYLRKQGCAKRNQPIDTASTRPGN